MTCECGASLVAPTLRKLRELPPAETTDPAEKLGSSWSFRHGTLTAGLLLAAVLAGAGAYLRANEPPPPEPFSAKVRDANVEESVANATPLELYGKWAYDHAALGRTGFSIYDNPRSKEILRTIEQLRLVQYSLLAAAGLVLVATIGVAVLAGGSS